jgi:RES domain-containing protein
VAIIDPRSWNPDDAIRRCPVRTDWSGRAWRFHRRDRTATDDRGALLFSGRFNRGLDLFPEVEVWPVLYLTLAPEVAIGERQRHLTIEHLSRLNDYRLTTLELRLQAVIDCTDMEQLGVSSEELCDNTYYDTGQRLAESVRHRLIAVDPGADVLSSMPVEAMIVPSATRLGNNLVVFPDRLHAESVIRVVSHVDPQLYVNRS